MGFELFLMSVSLPIEKRFRKKCYGLYVDTDKYNPLTIIVAIATMSVPESLNRLSYLSTSGKMNHLQMDAVRFVMSFL